MINSPALERNETRPLRVFSPSSNAFLATATSALNHASDGTGTAQHASIAWHEAALMLCFEQHRCSRHACGLRHFNLRRHAGAVCTAGLLFR